MSILFRAPLSRMQLSVPLPPKSEKEISISLTPISEAGSFRRAANGDLINVARSVFRKYSISIAGEDMIPPGIAGLFPGDYVEICLPDFITFSGDTVDRMSVDAHGLDSDGQKVDPQLFLNPSDYGRAYLQSTYSRVRIQELRQSGATQVPGASAVRCRPIFGCRVISWSMSKPESRARQTWNLNLEEA